MTDHDDATAIVHELVIEPFSQQFGMPGHDTERIFGTYVKALAGYSETDLLRVRDTLLETHIGKRWPTIAACVKLADGDRKSVADSIDDGEWATVTIDELKRSRGLEHLNQLWLAKVKNADRSARYYQIVRWWVHWKAREFVSYKERARHCIGLIAGWRDEWWHDVPESEVWRR